MSIQNTATSGLITDQRRRRAAVWPYEQLVLSDPTRIASPRQCKVIPETDRDGQPNPNYATKHRRERKVPVTVSQFQ